MNEEEGKEVTVEFLLNHLAVEDGNSQHRFLSQLDSSTSVNMVAYDRRQNKGKSNRSRNSNGRKGNRINQEDTTLHLPFKLLENPRYGREVHEVW